MANLPKQLPFILPQNWPNGVGFVNKLVWRDSRPPKSIFSEVLPIWPISHCKSVQVKLIDNEDHVLCGQRGLFSTEYIEKDQTIGSYVGNLHPESEISGASDYMIYIGRLIKPSNQLEKIYMDDIFCKEDWYIDAMQSGNETRFINDFRGISTQSNVRFVKTWLKETRSITIENHLRQAVEMEIFQGIEVVTTKPIEAGEEILIDYGPGFWTDL